MIGALGQVSSKVAVSRPFSMRSMIAAESPRAPPNEERMKWMEGTMGKWKISEAEEVLIVQVMSARKHSTVRMEAIHTFWLYD